MKFFLSILSLTLVMTSQAATLSCRQLSDVYQADQMNVGKYPSSRANQKRQEAQLRQTVKHFTSDTEGSDVGDDKTFKELKDEFQAYFWTLIAGDVELEVVNIDMGDNPFELFFEAGTTKDAGISTVDGSLEVGGKYCKQDVAFEPVLNSSRKHAICRAIVPLIKKGVPEFGHTDCVNTAPVDEETRNTTDFRVTGDFTKRSFDVAISRNLHDFDAGYFSCGASVNRKTNEVSKAKCSVIKRD